MTEGVLPPGRPTLALARAKQILLEHGVGEAVSLLGARGFFPAMGAGPGNDAGVYDDALFLVTHDDCRGFVANTDPSRFGTPNVTLRPGVWRYKPGRHVSPATGEAYDALVESGLPGEQVWVVAYPNTLEDYRKFARSPGIGMTAPLASIEEYRQALVARGGRPGPDGGIEWPMTAHINIHRGAAADTSSKGCQTVHPSAWTEFIGAVYAAMGNAGQAYLSYVLVDWT